MQRLLFITLLALLIAPVAALAQDSTAAPSGLVPTHGQSTDPHTELNVDPHAGHNHAPGEGHNEPALPMAESRDEAAVDAFAKAVDLSPLKMATVQHDSTLKTLDTFSRQLNSSITNRASIDGRDPLFSLLDFAYSPRAYIDAEIIKIRHLPLREDIADAVGLTGPENADARHKFLKDAKISLSFYERPDVQAALQRIETRELHKADAVRELRMAAESLKAMMVGGRSFPPIRVVPPAEGGRTGEWLTIDAIEGNSPTLMQAFTEMGLPILPPAEGYTGEQADPVASAAILLRGAWMSLDADRANDAIIKLADSLQDVNASAYPSLAKRKGEVYYNRLHKLTLPAAGFYFIGFALFLVAAYSQTPRARLWGLRMLIVALLVHTVGIAVRWWLTDKSTDDWFHSIPIKNQFESVMFSAWFGALVGLILELRRKSPGGGLFGAAASFVGWLSLLALFASPYVFGNDLGGNLRQASGVLMSYWLYIHVTAVTASYALIGMNFLLSVWWLVAYVRQLGQTAPVTAAPVANGGFFSTIGQVLFLPVGRAKDEDPYAAAARQVETRSLSSRLDAANLVVLQLAFWILGAGIVFGAVWADMSWGRPWGWDPKETFALVTWIVYLVILHTRLVTTRRAFWTAVLSAIGFFIMLFNWIGVNFFMQGLHSYA